MTTWGKDRLLFLHQAQRPHGPKTPASPIAARRARPARCPFRPRPTSTKRTLYKNPNTHTKRCTLVFISATRSLSRHINFYIRRGPPRTFTYVRLIASNFTMLARHISNYRVLWIRRHRCVRHEMTSISIRLRIAPPLCVRRRLQKQTKVASGE